MSATNVVPIRLVLPDAVAPRTAPSHPMQFKAWQVWTLVSGAAASIVILLFLVRAVAA